MMPDQIFISYSHKDSGWLQEFTTMLAPAASKGLVDPWNDEQIQPGEDWQTKIRDALRRAKVALLLVTPEFLQSPFIREKELRSILAAANDGALRVYWVPISESLVEYTDLGAIQAVHDPKQPLEALGPAERRSAVAGICRKLLDGLGQLPVVTRDERVSLLSTLSQRFESRYAILEEIGTGSSAIVFKAQDKQIDRLVAIKTLITSALQPHAVEAFQRQIEIGYSLTSSVYLRIFDQSLDQSPQLVVSEYTGACKLDNYLELSRQVPPRRTKAILLELARALAEAHGRGYLHSGLMLHHVYIDDNHSPRMSAFCFSSARPDAGRWGTFLINHETCTYLPPEQFKGQPRTQLSDQYALGLLGRALLTGKDIEPISCPADFVARPQVYAELASEDMGHVHQGLAGIVSRMLQVDPDDRWSSMQEVVELLNDVVVHDTDLDGLRRQVVASYTELQPLERANRFYEAVYRHLFALVPGAQDAFPRTKKGMVAQYRALNRAIKLLLDYNPAKPTTVAAVRETARHHIKYPLSGPALDAFLNAVLLALRDLDEPVRVVEAWRQILTHGLDEMRRVLASDAAQQPAAPTRG